MVDRLTPIPASELGLLKELLATDFPNHLVGYGLVATLEEWFRETTEVQHIEIYTLNNDWKSDGVVLVCVSEENLK